MEELCGRFWLLERVGRRRFLAINAALFCIPVFVFVSILRGRPLAYRLARLYPAVMVLNGVGHNLGVVTTRRCSGGFAGAVSGVALAITGAGLLRRLQGYPARGVP